MSLTLEQADEAELERRIEGIMEGWDALGTMWPHLYDRARALAQQSLADERKGDNMTTELATMAPQMLAFRSIDEIETFAKLIAQSVFVPAAFRGKPGDIIAAVMYGLERGLSPMTSLQNVAVINGRPSVYGDMLLALCLTDPSTESIDEAEPAEIEKTGLAWCEAKRKGRKTIRRTFSLDDARRARLTNKEGAWQDYPSRMLMMRARSWCLRDAFADRLMGLHAREEAQDIIDVTPTTAPPTAEEARVMTPQAPASAPAQDSAEKAVTGTPEPTYQSPFVASGPAASVRTPAHASAKPPASGLGSSPHSQERTPIEKLNHHDCEVRLEQELKRLCGTGQDATTKQHRTDVLTSVYGTAIDTFLKATGQGKTALQRGLVKLAAMTTEQPPTDQSPEEDMPHVPPSDGSPQDSRSLPPGDTIAAGPSLDAEADSADQDDAPEPPEEPSMQGGMTVDPGDVRILALWAAMNGQEDLYLTMTADKEMVDGTAVLSKRSYQIIRAAIAERIAAEVHA